jgi:hypothetical protein
MSGLNFYFEVCGHITQGHVPLSISHFLSTFRLLPLEKQLRDICSIMIGEVTYHLVAYTLAIQFKDIIVKHFSPH